MATTTKTIQRALQGKYTIHGVLGKGGYGIVFDATQLQTGQRVAIKVLRAERLTDEDQHATEVQRFQREAQMIARLNHPHIVRLLDSGTLAGGELYMVLEFVAGTALNSIIKSRQLLTPKITVRVMSQVLDALACAHDAGIVHRDLKPHNIMVTATGARSNAVVLDFGIATIEQAQRTDDFVALTTSGSIHGTPSYMAPEQLRLTGANPRSDIYAWGLVLIEALTGKRAISAPTLPETMAAQLSSDPVPIPPALDAIGLGDVIRRATAKDEEDRFQSAEQALEALEGVRLVPGVVTSAFADAEPLRANTLSQLGAPLEDTPRGGPPTDDSPVVTGVLAGEPPREPGVPMGIPMQAEGPPTEPDNMVIELDPPSEDQMVIKTTAWQSDPLIGVPSDSPHALELRKGRSLPIWLLPALVVGLVVLGLAIWTASGPGDESPQTSEADQPVASDGRRDGVASGHVAGIQADAESVADVAPASDLRAGLVAGTRAPDVQNADASNVALGADASQEAREPDDSRAKAEARAKAKAKADARAKAKAKARESKSKEQAQTQRAQAKALADEARKLLVKSPRQAAALYSDAVKLDSRNGNLRASYGVALERADKTCGAFKQYEKALAYGVSGRSRSMAQKKVDTLREQCD